MSLVPSLKVANLGNNFFTINSFLPYLRLTVKIFQFLRLSAKFLAVLRLSVNPIETLLPKACVHGFIRYCPSYCRAFTTKLMGLAVVKLEARKERSGLQPKHLDRQYLQDKQVLLDQFRKNRSTNSGTQFGIDLCFSLFSL